VTPPTPEKINTPCVLNFFIHTLYQSKYIPLLIIHTCTLLLKNAHLLLLEKAQLAMTFDTTFTTRPDTSDTG
jgi:hypothetical protein